MQHQVTAFPYIAVGEENKSAVLIGKGFSMPTGYGRIDPHRYLYAGFGFCPEKVVIIYISLDHDTFLDKMLRLERFHSGLLAPLVAAPALHQHEQVEVFAMAAVVGLEIVGNVFDVAFEVRLQQEIAHHLALVIGGHLGGIIAHRQREVALNGIASLVAHRKTEVHALHRCIKRFQRIDRNDDLPVAPVKGQPLGQDFALRGEKGDLLYPGLEIRLRERERHERVAPHVDQLKRMRQSAASHHQSHKLPLDRGTAA